MHQLDPWVALAVYVNCISALLKATLLLWSVGLTRHLGCQAQRQFYKIVGWIHKKSCLEA